MLEDQRERRRHRILLLGSCSASREHAGGKGESGRSLEIGHDLTPVGRSEPMWHRGNEPPTFHRVQDLLDEGADAVMHLLLEFDRLASLRADNLDGFVRDLSRFTVAIGRVDEMNRFESRNSIKNQLDKEVKLRTGLSAGLFSGLRIDIESERLEDLVR